MINDISMTQCLPVSIVIPAYNEYKSLPELLAGVAEQIDACDALIECIVVDDGSIDGSADRLTILQQKYTWLRPLYLTHHQGKSSALTAGIEAAVGQIIMTMDGDLQNDPSDFLALYNAMDEQELDMVVGWRKHRQDTTVKRILSFLYNKLLNVIFAMSLHDHNCGLKLIKKEVLMHCPLNGDWHRYVTVLVEHAGYRVGETLVSHHPRHHDRSRYGIGRYFKFLCDLPMLYVSVLRLKKSSTRKHSKTTES